MIYRQQEKINGMVSELESVVEEVLPQNTKRVKYFCGMTKKLSLISVYPDVLGFFGEDADNDEAYTMLEKLRVIWRNQEMKRIRDNLELTKYRLMSPEAVTAVTNGRRLEQVSRPGSSMHLTMAKFLPSARYVLYTCYFTGISRSSN